MAGALIEAEASTGSGSCSSRSGPRPTSSSTPATSTRTSSAPARRPVRPRDAETPCRPRVCQLRLQARPAPRRRRGLRLPVPAQPALGRRAAAADRPRRAGARYVLDRPETAEFLDRVDDLLEFAPARVPARGQVVPGHRRRLHRRPPPLGGHGRGAGPRGSRAGGYVLTRAPPRHRPMTASYPRSARRRPRRRPRPGGDPRRGPPLRRRRSPRSSRWPTTAGRAGGCGADFGIPAPGDVRRCLVALAPTRTALWARGVRAPLRRGELAGHALGNLVLAGLAASHRLLRPRPWPRRAGCSEAVRPGAAGDRRARSCSRPTSAAGSDAAARSRSRTPVGHRGLAACRLVPADAEPPAEALDAIAGRRPGRRSAPARCSRASSRSAAVPDLRDALASRTGGKVYVCNLKAPDARRRATTWPPTSPPSRATALDVDVVLVIHRDAGRSPADAGRRGGSAASADGWPTTRPAGGPRSCWRRRAATAQHWRAVIG